MKRYYKFFGALFTITLFTSSIALYQKYLQEKGLSPIGSKCETGWEFKLVQEGNQYIKMCNSGDLYMIRTFIYKTTNLSKEM